VLIRGATVCDPEQRRVVARDLAIVEGRVWSRCADADTAIDASSFFVLPGLIDMHAHLLPWPVDGIPEGPRLADAAGAIGSALEAGVTSIRDLGGDLATLLALKTGQAFGSVLPVRLFFSGPMLTVPGGHGSSGWHGVALSSETDAAAMVRGLHGAGVDQVKVVTSGANGRVQMPRNVLQSVIVHAQACELPVAVHAHLQPDQLAASVEFGARTIEHGFLLHRLPDVLAQAAASGTSLCPTLGVVEAVRRHPTHYGQRRIAASWEDALASVGAAHRAGVALVAGTDAGIFGQVCAGLWREIDLIAMATGSRWAGLAAATCAAGAALGLPGVGTIRDGAPADMVFLRRDPVHYEVGPGDVAAVILGGELVHGSLGLAG
jgi:imidazolonepropionase-like amidohydrolase